MLKRLLGATAALALFVSQVDAATIPYFTTWDPGNALGMLNAWIAGSLNPNVGSPIAAEQFPRNLLDNGDMQIYQHAQSGVSSTGNSNTTAGTTELSYGPDRWAVNVNFTTGAGTLTRASSSPTPPPGFQEEATVYRTSGSLGAPVCALQELPFQKAAAIAGKVVDFSVYEEALSGLNADNANMTFLAVITGTDSGGLGFGNLRGGSGVGMSTSTKAASVTGVASSNSITWTSNGLVNGQPVYFTASAMPTGLTSGQTYYVTNQSTNSIQLSLTYANAISTSPTVVTFSTNGTTVVGNAPTFTPAWTGLTIYSAGANGATGSTTQAGFGAALSSQYTLSASSWTRLDTGPLYLPQGITEAAVLACFLPNSGSSGGSTDGFAFTGAQLEVLTANRTAATAYEFQQPNFALAEAERFFYQLNDAAVGTVLGPQGTLLTTTTCQMAYELPVPMDTTPIASTNGNTTSTFKIYVAADTSTLTTATITFTYAGDNRGVSLTPTLTTASTAGWACQLVGQSASSGGYVNWGVDF